MTQSSWAVVTDFDGTLTDLDLGNELCRMVIPERFEALLKKFRSGELTLKDYQRELWTKFPVSKSKFEQSISKIARLRPGVNEFLEDCGLRGIPVYVASCGLLPYIHQTLDSLLTPKAKHAILETRANSIVFGASSIESIEMPSANSASEYSFDKGEWCRELRKRHTGGKLQILGIGNGTSDRSLIGNVDVLAATEGLQTHCEKLGVAHVSFHDFVDLKTKVELFGSRTERA